MFMECIEATTDQLLWVFFEFYEPKKTVLMHSKEQPMKIDYMLLDFVQNGKSNTTTRTHFCRSWDWGNGDVTGVANCNEKFIISLSAKVRWKAHR